MINSEIDWAEVPFRTSSYSETNGGNCVEVGWADVRFRKSSYSKTNGGECVEVGAVTGAVGVRDSKNRDGGVLAFTPEQWSTFAARAKSGDLDPRP